MHGSGMHPLENKMRFRYMANLINKLDRMSDARRFLLALGIGTYALAISNFPYSNNTQAVGLGCSIGHQKYLESMEWVISS